MASHQAATAEMCCVCFDAIIGRLNNEKPAKRSVTFDTQQCFPLFVTWNKLSSVDNEYRLRGCIGTFSSHFPLESTLSDYAITSAFEDHRFNPISKSELPKLKCSVSLLVQFEYAENVYDWTIGVHGIRITFPSDPNNSASRSLSATYLPDVCGEQGWTKQECLQSLYRKAGYKGSFSPQLLARTRLQRYQSSKYQLTYDEYVKM